MNEHAYALVKTNERFERGWNRLQSSIEIITTITVIAGLIGLFGTGLLSHAVATDPVNGINISYDRVLRRTKQSDLTISLSKPAAQDTLEVRLPLGFLNAMDVVSSSPRSSAMRAEPDGVTYVFDLGHAHVGQIRLSLKPTGFGPLRSSIRADGAPIVLHQFIWP